MRPPSNYCNDLFAALKASLCKIGPLLIGLIYQTAVLLVDPICIGKDCKSIEMDTSTWCILVICIRSGSFSTTYSIRALSKNNWSTACYLLFIIVALTYWTCCLWKPLTWNKSAGGLVCNGPHETNDQKLRTAVKKRNVFFTLFPLSFRNEQTE